MVQNVLNRSARPPRLISMTHVGARQHEALVLLNGFVCHSGDRSRIHVTKPPDDTHRDSAGVCTLLQRASSAVADRSGIKRLPRVGEGVRVAVRAPRPYSTCKEEWGFAYVRLARRPLQCGEVWCANAVSPQGADRRDAVRKAPLVVMPACGPQLG